MRDHPASDEIQRDLFQRCDREEKWLKQFEHLWRRCQVSVRPHHNEINWRWSSCHPSVPCESSIVQIDFFPFLLTRLMSICLFILWCLSSNASFREESFAWPLSSFIGSVVSPFRVILKKAIPRRSIPRQQRRTVRQRLISKKSRFDLHWKSISLQLAERTVRRFSAEISTWMANQFIDDDLSGQRIGSSAIQMEWSGRWMPLILLIDFCNVRRCVAGSERVTLRMKSLFSFRREKFSSDARLMLKMNGEMWIGIIGMSLLSMEDQLDLLSFHLPILLQRSSVRWDTRDGKQSKVFRQWFPSFFAQQTLPITSCRLWTMWSEILFFLLVRQLISITQGETEEWQRMAFPSVRFGEQKSLDDWRRGFLVDSKNLFPRSTKRPLKDTDRRPTLTKKNFPTKDGNNLSRRV